MPYLHKVNIEDWYKTFWHTLLLIFIPSLIVKVFAVRRWFSFESIFFNDPYRNLWTHSFMSPAALSYKIKSSTQKVWPVFVTSRSPSCAEYQNAFLSLSLSPERNTTCVFLCHSRRVTGRSNLDLFPWKILPVCPWAARKSKAAICHLDCVSVPSRVWSLGQRERRNEAALLLHVWNQFIFTTPGQWINNIYRNRHIIDINR